MTNGTCLFCGDPAGADELCMFDGLCVACGAGRTDEEEFEDNLEIARLLQADPELRQQAAHNSFLIREWLRD